MAPSACLTVFALACMSPYCQDDNDALRRELSEFSTHTSTMMMHIHNQVVQIMSVLKVVQRGQGSSRAEIPSPPRPGEAGSLPAKARDDIPREEPVPAATSAPLAAHEPQVSWMFPSSKAEVSCRVTADAPSDLTGQQPFSSWIQEGPVSR